MLCSIRTATCNCNVCKIVDGTHFVKNLESGLPYVFKLRLWMTELWFFIVHWLFSWDTCFEAKLTFWFLHLYGYLNYNLNERTNDRFPQKRFYKFCVLYHQTRPLMSSQRRDLFYLTLFLSALFFSTILVYYFY